MKKTVTFVVPVYRNEGSIKPLHVSLVKEFQDNFPELEYEIVFVDDGSDDNSLRDIMDVKFIDKNVKVIVLSRNFGQMGAIIAGWDKAKGNAVMNISADRQEPVEQYTKMIKEWLAGAEIVIGIRENREDSGFTKFKSRIFYRLIKISIPEIPIGGFDVTLLDRKALNSLSTLQERGRFYQGNILWLGFAKKYVPYTRLKREIGKSQNNFFKMFAYTVNAYLNSSYLPLRMLSIIGFIVSFTGFAYALAIIYAYAVHNTPFQGWAPIMMTLLIIGGIIMLMLGVLGEYIWRILDEVKHRPYYIIKDSLD